MTGPVRAVLTGRPARFTVAVTNTGTVPLRAVTLGATVPGCSGLLGDLAPGQVGRPLHCERAMESDDLVNAVTATGTDPAGRPVTGTGSATARWARTGIGVTAVPDTLRADAGSLITTTVTMHNTGNVDLVNVVVTDPALPACERVLDRLAAGSRQDWTCVTTAPARGEVTNTVSATGMPDVEDATPIAARTTAWVQVLAALPPGVLVPPASDSEPERPRLATTAVRVDPVSAFGLGMLLAGALMMLAGLRRRRYPVRGAYRRD
ncbi:DUF7507 domain-containing protein [Gandjariella thermophila]|uniref:DUF7507 domain-containing protein n=1 Tax=Gandjariella thermophila TaxID=1931992 RepID=UPI00129B3536|nr:hypothetical protein [Gandjariella thermophila]